MLVSILSVFPLFFSSEIIISSTFLESTSDSGFGFTILLAILFPINFPIALAALWATVLEAVFKTSSHAFVAAFNNFFPELLDTFLVNDKNPYPLIYFIVLGSTD